MSFLGEVEPPVEVVWVEFDYRESVAARVHRNSAVIAHEKNAKGSGQRGYLIDRRKADALRVTMFSCDSAGRVRDPFFTLYFDQAEQGAPGLTILRPQMHGYMDDILSERGIAAEEMAARSQINLVEAASDLFIPYALFAMLVSPDLGRSFRQRRFYSYRRNCGRRGDSESHGSSARRNPTLPSGSDRKRLRTCKSVSRATSLSGKLGRAAMVPFGIG